MTEPFDIFHAALDALVLVEASAGTGKTYNIAGLYLRLVVERGLRVHEILVVTYTNAATEELRDRIRRRLVEARQAFQVQVSDDPICRQLLARHAEERERTLRRLNNAILAFDQAAIFTIHGFCQRVLADSAFESGMPFETEIVADGSELLNQIVEDFWRRRFHNLRPLLAGHVIDQKLSPEGLRNAIRSYLGRPYLHVIGLTETGELAGAEDEFRQAFAAARGFWWASRDEVTALLLEQNVLNAASYKRSSMPHWFDAMDEYLGEDARSDPRPFKQFEYFTRPKLEKATRKGKVTPRHAFFEACAVLGTAVAQLEAYFSRYLQALHHDLLAYCNTELPSRKRREQTQSYDDLLLNLHAALQAPGRGAQLAESIRNRYRAALIDEFQDTDPIQYDIFTSIYKHSGQPVFLVGDPKQAIYSFRGADIFAYLRAKQEAGGEYTLATNWRSDPELITAFNALFGLCPEPFLLPEIPFHPVQAAAQEHPRLVTPGDEQGPLRIWFMAREEGGKPLSKGAARPRIAEATAGRIAGLLNQGERGEAYLVRAGTRRSLRGGDMAVLVRNHRQAGEIRRALLALGVPSVEQSRDSVFETPEALDLERVLLALVTPRREERLRAALVTDLLGLSAAALHGLLTDDRDWEQLLSEFHGYHQLWREQGFIRMFRNLLLGRDVYRRLLGFRDGERRMTNLLHLAELLQEASVNQRLGMEGLVQWLAAQRAEPAADQETQQLRLESDADLVQIVTIHKSKGLEYPIVFCPFLWDARLWSESEDIITFHDPGRDNAAVLDMGSEDRDRHRLFAEREELAEELRLAYVALTRAQYRCYTVWGSMRDGDKSALAWLLYRPPVVQADKDLHGAHREYVKGLNDEALLSGLQRLTERGAGTVHVSPLPAENQPYRPHRADGEAFRARRFAGEPRMGWRFSSFTALQERRGGELPDYDAGVQTAAPPDTSGRNIFTFPQGARAGRCLHAIFEQIDFTRGDDPLILTTRNLLRKYGFASEWVDVVVRMVKRVLQVPLDPEKAVTLGGVGLAQRLTELAFMYRFAELDARALEGVLSKHGEPWAAALESAAFRLGEGFMRGFIDLAFAAGGRVYLVDYKSNWLGPASEDYGQRSLARAMAAGGYHLQYLIYTVALHRYLKWRRPGYDYDRHFGGVRYLFLRGMHPRNPHQGVYPARPSADLITELDAYLAEREVRNA